MTHAHTQYFVGLEHAHVAVYGDLTPEPSREAGGDDMWGKLVPYAWQLLQDPRSDSPVPAYPSLQKGGADNPQIAWWSPLLHLLFYALGWPRPELGIMRWIDAGRPTDDDVLRLVNRLFVVARSTTKSHVSQDLLDIVQ